MMSRVKLKVFEKKVTFIRKQQKTDRNSVPVLSVITLTFSKIAPLSQFWSLSSLVCKFYIIFVIFKELAINVIIETDRNVKVKNW